MTQLTVFLHIVEPPTDKVNGQQKMNYFKIKICLKKGNSNMLNLQTYSALRIMNIRST